MSLQSIANPVELHTIPGFEGYIGWRIWLDQRVETRWRKSQRMVLTDEWRPQKIHDGSEGYLAFAVNVVGGGRKRQKKIRVNRFMLLAFAGPAPAGKPHALHRDDNKANNDLSNLYWGSDLENRADAVRNGKVLRGEEHRDAKLSEEEVREILKLLSEGNLSQEKIAVKYGVSQVAVSAIKIGRSWAHLRQADGMVASTD